MKTTSILLAATVAFGAVAPVIAPAQSLEDIIRRRGQKENEWRNIGLGSAGVALAGILLKNNTLTYAGVGGGLYSLYRYNADKRSRNAAERRRAQFYSQPSRVYQGKRYKRVKVKRNGQQYYQYVRR